MVSLLIFVFPPGYFGANPAMRQIGYCLILVMFAGMDLLTGTYKCIVRLSVPYDLIKIFWCIVLTCATVGLTSIIYAATTSAHHLLIGILPLILIGGMAMSLMISLRIVVKYSYERLEAVTSSRKPVIVLGSAINSLALASTLKSEAGGHFNPVALLSLSDSHYKKESTDCRWKSSLPKQLTSFSHDITPIPWYFSRPSLSKCEADWPNNS